MKKPKSFKINDITISIIKKRTNDTYYIETFHTSLLSMIFAREYIKWLTNAIMFCEAHNEKT